MILCVEISIYLKKTIESFYVLFMILKVCEFFFAASFMGKTASKSIWIRWNKLCYFVFCFQQAPMSKDCSQPYIFYTPIRNKKVITQKHTEMFVQNSHCKRDLWIYWTYSLASVRDLQGPRYWRSLYSHFVIGTLWWWL